MKSGDLRTREHIGGIEDIETIEELHGWAGLLLDLIMSFFHSEEYYGDIGS